MEGVDYHAADCGAECYDEDEDGEGEDDDETVGWPAEYNVDMKDRAVILTQPIETDFEARNRDRISWL